MVDQDGNPIMITDLEEVEDIGVILKVGSVKVGEFELYPENNDDGQPIEHQITITEALPTNLINLKITHALSKTFPVGPIFIEGNAVFIDEDWPDGRHKPFAVNNPGQVGKGISGANDTPD